MADKIWSRIYKNNMARTRVLLVMFKYTLPTADKLFFVAVKKVKYVILLTHLNWVQMIVHKSAYIIYY